MSSLGDQVRDWHQGVLAVGREDWDCALRLFSVVREPSAKMSFNMGCVHLMAGDPEAALRGFHQAVAKDTCMAVGFFQRGVAYFLLERFQEAASDFQLALAQLRGNAAIDYTQLGLRFRLQAWEVLYNMASAQCRAGLWTKAAGTLAEAISKWSEEARDSLDIALDQVQVVASVIPDNHNPDVRPQQRSQVEQVGQQSPPAMVCWHPEGPVPLKTPQELGFPSSLYSVPLGPRTKLPLKTMEACFCPQGAAAKDPEPSEAVTVQCHFTVPLKAARGTGLSSFRKLLAQAPFTRPRQGSSVTKPQGRSPGSPSLGGVPAECVEECGHGPKRTAAAVPGAWGRPVLHQVVAQHSYPAQRPEDLDFRQGDTVDVLCEVDDAWLEGHRDGRIGIFPKCFVVPAGARVEAAPVPGPRPGDQH